MDCGKYRYQHDKAKKTKVHQQKLKEIRVRPKTGDHDIDTKINQARKFLEHKDKVLVYVIFKAASYSTSRKAAASSTALSKSSPTWPRSRRPPEWKAGA
jgi:translation initiation factor IF-3